MSKVLVDREWLKRLHRDLDACQKVIWLGLRGADPAYCQDAQDRLKEIDELLARPAEAEGVAVVAWANEALSAFISADCKAYGDSRGGAAGSAAGAHQTPLVRQSDHLAALSAVTAERDRLRDKALPDGYTAVRTDAILFLLGLAHEPFTAPVGAGSFWWRQRLHEAIPGGLEAMIAAMSAKEA